MEKRPRAGSFSTLGLGTVLTPAAFFLSPSVEAASIQSHEILRGLFGEKVALWGVICKIDASTTVDAIC
jgi:hypothetical protein